MRRGQRQWLPQEQPRTARYRSGGPAVPPGSAALFLISGNLDSVRERLWPARLGRASLLRCSRRLQTLRLGIGCCAGVCLRPVATAGPIHRLACILANNYGEAGALHLFGPRYGLPSASAPIRAIFWGPPDSKGDNLIVLQWSSGRVGHLGTGQRSVDVGQCHPANRVHVIRRHVGDALHLDGAYSATSGTVASRSSPGIAGTGACLTGSGPCRQRYCSV